MDDTTYILPPNRGFISVAGADARPFLQGIVTNDVDAIDASRAQYAAMLTPQGRIMWDFFLAELEDGRLLLDCDRDGLPAFLKRLSMYRLRADVALTDASDAFAAIAFPGAEAPAALDLDGAPGSARPWNGGVLYTDPRLAALGARAIVPTDRLDVALAETGFAAGDTASYDRLRLALGVPEGADDLPPERALPLEVGFDELNALSWTKGCYMGQELTARMNYRALVKKRLLPVAIDGPPPAPGTPVELDGKDAGEMRSSNGDRGLAYLRLAAAESGQVLTCGEARLTPSRPDWFKRPES
jgi:folate-binding protein YgfZ